MRTHGFGAARASEFANRLAIQLQAPTDRGDRHAALDQHLDLLIPGAVALLNAATGGRRWRGW
jgi:hypothetical protein